MVRARLAEKLIVLADALDRLAARVDPPHRRHDLPRPQTGPHRQRRRHDIEVAVAGDGVSTHAVERLAARVRELGGGGNPRL